MQFIDSDCDRHTLTKKRTYFFGKKGTRRVIFQATGVPDQIVKKRSLSEVKL